MLCPKCGNRLGVVETRDWSDGNVYRRRKCKNCGHLIATIEIKIPYDNQFRREWNDAVIRARQIREEKKNGTC